MQKAVMRSEFGGPRSFRISISELDFPIISELELDEFFSFQDKTKQVKTLYQFIVRYYSLQYQL